MSRDPWEESGGAWARLYRGRKLRVWREWAWRWSMDGERAERSEATLAKARRLAEEAVKRGRLPIENKTGGRGK